MTRVQKIVITELLKGGNIAYMPKSGIRLRDKQANPVRKVSARTFHNLRDLMKKHKSGLWIISRAAIIKLPKNTWAKQEYKLLKNTQK